MPFWSRIFGSTPSEPAPARGEDYKGFRITPAPIQEGGQFRVSARIEKAIDGTTRTHTLIRADTMASRDEAAAISLAKARQVIDERGAALFG
jgi:hypothetical protein